MKIDINNIDPKHLEEDDRIVSYLKGKMTMEEEQQFFKELEENPELKEKAVVTARLVKGLKQVGNEQDKDVKCAFLASNEQDIKIIAKQVIQIDEAKKSKEKILRLEEATNRFVKVLGIDLPKNPDPMVAATEILERFATDYEGSRVASCMMPNENRQKESTPKIVSKQKRLKNTTIRKVPSWFAVAASLIFIVWVGIYYNSYRVTTGLGNIYSDALTSEMRIVRGEPSKTEEKLMPLIKDVRNGENIKTVIHDLSLYWELSLMDTYNDYTDYSAEIGWNLVIAYLKDNNKKEAKKVLEKLIETSEGGSLVNTKSKELLERLNY